MTRRTGLARLGRLGGRREEGQTIVIVALCLVVFIGAAGLVIDVANLYVTQRHLQTAADAAALAAAQDLPNSTTSACTYSASTAGSTTCTVNGANVALAGNGNNYGTTFGNVQTTAQVECVSVASAGTPCQTGTACPTHYLPAGTTTNLGCNAIKVTEQTSVTPFFMGALGFGSQTITASATAGLAGGTPEPLDVEMIDDTTASMGDSDSCGGTPTDVPSTVSLTQEDCAKAGIRALLTTLYPCTQTLASCGPYLNDQTQASGGAVDEVGLVSFPGLTGLSAGSDGSLSNELDCASNVTSSNVSYGSGANYQVVPFSSDFRYSDASTADRLATLNTSSNLVRAVYWPGDGCPNGGYPIQGGSTSSISGGGAGDTTTAATSSGATIAGGASTAADTASATNAGITQGNSTATANSGGDRAGQVDEHEHQPGDDRRRPASAAAAATPTPTTVTSATGITIARPSTRAAGDFLLLTVTGQSASVTSTSIICPSGTTTGWTLVGTQQVAGTLVQATYSSTRSTNASESYTFNFYSSGTCASPVTALALTASATVLRYTNVTGIDASNLSSGVPTVTNWSGSSANTGWSLGTFGGPTIPSTGAMSWSGTTAAPNYASLSTACESTSSSACLTDGRDGRNDHGLHLQLQQQDPQQGRLHRDAARRRQRHHQQRAATARSAARGRAARSAGTVTVAATDKIQLSVALTTGGATSDVGDRLGHPAGRGGHPLRLAVDCLLERLGRHLRRDERPGDGHAHLGEPDLRHERPRRRHLHRDALPERRRDRLDLHDRRRDEDLLDRRRPRPDGQRQARAAGRAHHAAAPPSPRPRRPRPSRRAAGTSLTAPATAGNTPAGDQVVRLFGTGATSFSAPAPPLTVASGTTATGADDGVQATTATQRHRDRDDSVLQRLGRPDGDAAPGPRELDHRDAAL